MAVGIGDDVAVGIGRRVGVGVGGTVDVGVGGEVGVGGVVGVTVGGGVEVGWDVGVGEGGGGVLVGRKVAVASGRAGSDVSVPASGVFVGVGDMCSGGTMIVFSSGVKRLSTSQAGGVSTSTRIGSIVVLGMREYS